MSGPLLAPVDVAQVRRQFARATARGRVDPLAREIAQRMAERLDYVNLSPASVLDIGAGDGSDALSLLRQRYPQASMVLVDSDGGALPKAVENGWWQKQLQRLLPAQPGLTCIQADASALPLSAGSQQLVWSNFLLPWVPDLSAVVDEVHRVLAPEGLFMFSTLGPDTLQELVACFGDAFPHVHRFPDMHDLGDLLVRTGFADPVMDMEILNVRYASLDRLIEDLRLAGANSAHADRRRKLMGKRAWQSVKEAWASRQAGDGTVTVRLEVVYGHAWHVPKQVLQDGRQVIHFKPRPG